MNYLYTLKGLNDDQKSTCEEVLKNGKLLYHKNLKSDEGDQVEGFRVMYLNEIYDMTKSNGEWTYFLHN